MKRYNNYDIDNYQIDTIKSILFDDNKTSWIKSYINKHGIDKEKLRDILNGNFSQENYPEISYWKTHHFKLFIESVKRAILIYDKLLEKKEELDKKKINISLIKSILLNENIPWIKKIIKSYFFNEIKLKDMLFSFLSFKNYKEQKHLYPELKYWGPKKFQMFYEIINEAIIVHDNIIEDLPNNKVFGKALELNYLSYKNIYLLSGKSSCLELAILCFPKYVDILNDYLINSMSLSDISIKHNITRERARQITVQLSNNSKLNKAYNFYLKNNFEEKNSEFNSNLDVIELKYLTKAAYRKGPNIQDPYQEILFLLEGNREYIDFKLDLGERIYLNKELYKRFYNDFKKLNMDLSDIGFYIIDEDNLDFVDFVKSNVDLIIPKLKINKNFLYIPTKIKLLNIAEMAIDANILNSLVDIQGVHNWIKKNFPEKAPSGILSLRNQLLRNNLIFAFGKTGNYQKVSIKGQKTFHTIDLIIEILNKSKFPLHQNEIEELVQKRNPYLKDRGVHMIIEINPDKFVKFKGTGFIGLKGKKYSELPTKLPKRQINNYLKSKSLLIEWLSFDYLINEYGINDYQLIDFIENSNEYIYLDNLITLSSKNKNKDNLIKKLCKEEKLIPHIKETYLNKSITEKINFRDKLIDIINKNYGIILSSDELSKIINFII
jgi:hypothetical protein